MLIPELDQINFTENAGDDIYEIWSFISLDSTRYADKTVDDLISTIRMIGNNREVGRRRDDFMIGLRLFPLKSYNIYYFPTTEGIIIYRVLHSARDASQIFDDPIDLPKKNV